MRVDPAPRTVLVGALDVNGAMWTTQRTPLAWPCHRALSAAQAWLGSLLGGGMGHLTRKFGLTIDNLLSVDMVLADGRFVVANARTKTPIFSGPCGAEGETSEFVTSFLFEAHPVSDPCARGRCSGIWRMRRT